VTIRIIRVIRGQSVGAFHAPDQDAKKQEAETKRWSSSTLALSTSVER
jgi:hypothetical protein